MWGATGRRLQINVREVTFQSTLPMWGATRNPGTLGVLSHISIHAPHVGSDQERRGGHGAYHYFNPRSPCGERPARYSDPSSAVHFNPRSPCGERRITIAGNSRLNNFNPRSPCGERQVACKNDDWTGQFQSTLPMWGATCGIQADCVFSPIFQSTLPMWGATKMAARNQPCKIFQSTLPMWGATTFIAFLSDGFAHFNPRSPCGERQR